MAHFVITLDHPAKTQDELATGWTARYVLNGMDISESVAECVLRLDINEPPTVELVISLASLRIAGDLRPEIEAQLPQALPPGQAAERRELPLAGGGWLRLVKGVET
jgi:hypothetical protein